MPRGFSFSGIRSFSRGLFGLTNAPYQIAGRGQSVFTSSIGAIRPFHINQKKKRCTYTYSGGAISAYLSLHAQMSTLPEEYFEQNFFDIYVSGKSFFKSFHPDHDDLRFGQRFQDFDPCIQKLVKKHPSLTQEDKSEIEKSKKEGTNISFKLFRKIDDIVSEELFKIASVKPNVKVRKGQVTRFEKLDDEYVREYYFDEVTNSEKYEDRRNDGTHNFYNYMQDYMVYPINVHREEEDGQIKIDYKPEHYAEAFYGKSKAELVDMFEKQTILIDGISPGSMWMLADALKYYPNARIIIKLSSNLSDGELPEIRSKLSPTARQYYDDFCSPGPNGEPPRVQVFSSQSKIIQHEDGTFTIEGEELNTGEESLAAFGKMIACHGYKERELSIVSPNINYYTPSTLLGSFGKLYAPRSLPPGANIIRTALLLATNAAFFYQRTITLPSFIFDNQIEKLKKSIYERAVAGWFGQLSESQLKDLKTVLKSDLIKDYYHHIANLEEPPLGVDNIEQMLETIVHDEKKHYENLPEAGLEIIIRVIEEDMKHYDEAKHVTEALYEVSEQVQEHHPELKT